VAVSVVYDFLKTRTRLVANITINAGYHVVGSYLERNSSLICAGAVSPQISDAVAFDLEPTPSGGFAMTHIVNSTTIYKPPKFPVPVPETSVTLATGPGSTPEVLDATGGSGELQTGANLMTVLVLGTQRIGRCAFHGKGGSTTGPGSTDDARVSLSFVTTMFSGGTQVGKPDGNSPWAWVVNEQ
jgi:hypothetical protein